MRLGYLCNVYPAVSHSFVRREIEALEALGHEVCRFSIRPANADLKDPADMREAVRTESVLGRSRTSFLATALVELLSHPLRSLTALTAAYRLSGPGWAQRMRHAAYLLEAAWLVRRLKELRVTHVHAHFGTNPAAVSLLVKKLGGPPFSFTIHGPDEFDAPALLSIGDKVSEARFVAVISSFGRSQLMRWTPPKQWSKIKVIRCGVDRTFLDRRTEFHDSTEFCCVARLAPQKGLPLLIEACQRIDLAGLDFSLTIIGDGELKSLLEAEVEARGLQARVLLAGSKSAAEIRQALERARAFVLPSFAEGLPVVLMEALALSRPVIATAVAGIPELVDAECGWLVQAGSVEALAAAMQAALEASPEELIAKGEVGRERVNRMHSASREAALLAQAMQGKESSLPSSRSMAAGAQASLNGE